MRYTKLFEIISFEIIPSKKMANNLHCNVNLSPLKGNKFVSFKKISIAPKA